MGATLLRKKKRSQITKETIKRNKRKIGTGFGPTNNIVEKKPKQRRDPHNDLQKASDSFLSK